MAPPARSWFRSALVVALIYAMTGLATVAASRAAGGAGIHAVVRAIRAASWLASAVVFLLHVTIENRTRPKPTVAAWHASAAVALATLLLALVATGRQLAAGNTRPSVFVAIGVWPILTGLVSFVVGVVVSVLLQKGMSPST